MRNLKVTIGEYKKTVKTACRCGTPEIVTGLISEDGKTFKIDDGELVELTVEKGSSPLYCDACKEPMLTIKFSREVRVFPENIEKGRSPFSRKME